MNEQKKVLLISPNFDGKKSWMQCAVITANNLVKAGFDVTVLTTNTEGQKEYEIINNIKIYRVKSFLLPDPINMSVPNIFSFWKKLKQLQADIIILNKTWFLTSLIAAIYYRGKTKYYVQLDTLIGKIWFHPSKIMNVAMWIFARTINRYILDGSKKCLIYHSGLVSTMHEWELDYEIINQGVDFKKFSEAIPCQEILDFKKDKVCFLFVGRLDSIKRWREYVQTCLKVNKERNGKVCFVFVCGAKHPKLQLELKYLMHGTDSLILGYRSDVANVMKASDCLVLPSKFEGNPDVIMEAQSSKLCCIATNVPNSGIQDMIKHNETGLLFNSFITLKLKMLNMIDCRHYRALLAMKGQEHVKQWDNEEIIKQLRKSI